MSDQTFDLLWPERRRVDAQRVMSWARDAVANGEIDPDGVDLTDPRDCARALEEAGHITVSSKGS